MIKASGIWANPDVGNFPDEEARAAGLRAMYPLSSGSSHCHYNPERYNEANAIRISKEVGYKGLYSIEASANNGPDPYAAVQTILDELLRDLYPALAVASQESALIPCGCLARRRRPLFCSGRRGSRLVEHPQSRQAHGPWHFGSTQLGVQVQRPRAVTRHQPFGAQERRARDHWKNGRLGAAQRCLQRFGRLHAADHSDRRRRGAGNLRDRRRRSVSSVRPALWRPCARRWW